MDPLRLTGIVQDGDFSRVRQLVQENLPISPNAVQQHETPQERMQRRDHPWKSPIARYRMKQLANSTECDEDRDLEELSWKHRAKAYDLVRSDVTSKRVYHSEEVENYNEEKSYHYTNRRPKSIETDLATKMVDEQVVTPATAPMDEDEFDSPYSASTQSASTPTSITLLDSSPSAVTPPKEILDQLAIDNRQNSEIEAEGTEVTLEMFEDDDFFRGIRENIQKEQSPKNLDIAVKEMLERKSGVKQLIAEHERLMAQTKRTVAGSPESFAKSQSRIFRQNRVDGDEKNSPSLNDEEAIVDSGSVTTLYGEKIIDASNKEPVTPEAYTNKINTDQPVIIFEYENLDEAFLPRSSILTTIVEEATPLKISSPLTLSPDRTDKNSKVVDAFSRVQTLKFVSPENKDEAKKLTYTREEFKASRIKPLNKVTIAAALIEFNNILMEESNSFHGEKMTDDSRLFKAIMKHRKQNGFFTSTTPTHESLRNGAATVIQAFWRTVLAIRCAQRKVDVARNFAASMIQAQWRAYDSRMTYKWHRGSAIIVQAKWKSYKLRKQFKVLRTSAIRIQSISRMNQCQAKFLQQKIAAIALQTKWRSHNYEKQYNVLRSSTLLVQSIVRMHQERKEYMHKKKSIVDVQSQWRSYNRRKQFRSLRSAAIKIQSISRMYESRTAYSKAKLSSQTLQSNWRSFICQKQYNSMRSSTILVQSVVRMHQNQKQFCQMKSSALSLQMEWRRHTSQRKYSSMRSSAVLVQSLVRMQQHRAKFLEMKAASVSIQAAMRMFCCRRNYTECRKAVTTLQSIQRMNICRSKYTRSREAAIMLQSQSRLRVSRAKYLKQKAASTILQSSWRMIQDRSTLARSINSATIMQATARAFLCRALYLKQKRAAIKLQGVARMNVSRRNYLLQKTAALVVQNSFREFMCRKDYATFEAIREIQVRWRSSAVRSDHLALMQIKNIATSHRTSICKQNFMEHVSSSIIQKHWRKHAQRKSMEAVTQIQSKWRAFQCRKTYIATLDSIRLLQSHYRACIQRRKYLRAVDSAVKIQSMCRAYVCRKNYAFLVSKATKLESVVRMYLWRGRYTQYKASRRIQAAARMYLCRSQLIMCCKAATKIQSLFRSYSCRKEIEALKTQIHDEHEDIDDDNDGTFWGRSSILTTIVEERASLSFASPPLEVPKRLSDPYEDESEEEILPSTIKKKRIDTIMEENPEQSNKETQDQVQTRSNDVLGLPVSKEHEFESRRTSEERLKALAAKVAAKRRASLKRNKTEPVTRDPWQERRESEKRSKPVLLSKRMSELEKLAKHKKVSTSRWNSNQKQNNQAAGVADKGPLSRYENDRRADDNDSVVKKLFEPGTFEELVKNPMDSSEPISENQISVVQEIKDADNGTSSIGIISDNEEAIDSVSENGASDVSFDHPVIDDESLEKEKNNNVISMNEVEHFDSDDELKPAISSWKRQSIVYDLADEIYGGDFMSDSDSDNESLSSGQYPEPKTVSNRTNGNNTGVSDLKNDKIMKSEDVSSPSREWSVVDDLIDDEDESLGSDDDDDFEETNTTKKNGMSFQSPVAISKIRKEHPLWNITRDDVSESISSSFYTVAGVAASLIGMGRE